MHRFKYRQYILSQTEVTTQTQPEALRIHVIPEYSHRCLRSFIHIYLKINYLKCAISFVFTFNFFFVNRLVRWKLHRVRPLSQRPLWELGDVCGDLWRWWVRVSVRGWWSVLWRILRERQPVRAAKSLQKRCCLRQHIQRRIFLQVNLQQFCIKDATPPPPSSRSNCFKFHAVFLRMSKIIDWRPRIWDWRYPCLGNSGSVTALGIVFFFNRLIKNVLRARKDMEYYPFNGIQDSFVPLYQNKRSDKNQLIKINFHQNFLNWMILSKMSIKQEKQKK